MALKRTKIDKWQRCEERLERMQDAAVESEAADDRSKAVVELAPAKRKAAAA